MGCKVLFLLMNSRHVSRMFLDGRNWCFQVNVSLLDRKGLSWSTTISTSIGELNTAS